MCRGLLAACALASLLTLLGACGEASTSPDADERDAGPPPPPYALCDGSDEVRFAAVVTESDPVGRVEITNPYGQTFLYITGKCEFLAGMHRAGGMVSGTLSASEAAALEVRLALGSLSTFGHVDHDGCIDGGSHTIATQDGYGSCYCGCDEDAPEGLEAMMASAQTTYDTLRSAGRALSGDVELGALVAQKYGMTFHPWPLELDLAPLAITEDAYRVTRMLPFTTLTGADADALRTLRAAEPIRATNQARFVEQAGASYELYILDVIPERFTTAIAAFERRPR